MEIAVPYPLAPGYTIAPARPELAEPIHRMIVESEIAEFGEATGYSLDELRDDLEALDPERDAWVVIDPAGSIAGYAYIRDRAHVRMDVEGYVHPDHTGHGIGTTLIRLGEARAREHVPLAPPEERVVLHNWINAENAAAREILEREGYTPFRSFRRMEMALDDSLPAPEWPDNIYVRACMPDQDEHLFYTTLEESMADHWGHIPTDFDAWLERRKRGSFDPSLWFLALDGDEPAGAAICTVSDGVGWVDYLGVRAPWRRHGLGMALLRHSAREFRGRNLDRMALGVDSDSLTGATRLYERAGMHIAQHHATYGKELRPGTDRAAEADHPATTADAP
jgi:mycothiol synthase